MAQDGYRVGPGTILARRERASQDDTAPQDVEQIGRGRRRVHSDRLIKSGQRALLVEAVCRNVQRARPFLQGEKLNPGN